MIGPAAAPNAPAAPVIANCIVPIICLASVPSPDVRNRSVANNCNPMCVNLWENCFSIPEEACVTLLREPVTLAISEAEASPPTAESVMLVLISPIGLFRKPLNARYGLLLFFVFALVIFDQGIHQIEFSHHVFILVEQSARKRQRLSFPATLIQLDFCQRNLVRPWHVAPGTMLHRRNILWAIAAETRK